MRHKTILSILLMSSVSGWAEVRFQNFDTDPLWDGHNNFSTAFDQRPVVQDFGYSLTTHCNLSVGEVGGTITPDGKAAYYAKPLTPLSFETGFSASGTMVVEAGGGNTLIGFFNSSTVNEWRTPNTVVFRIYGRGDVFNVYFEYGTSLWRVSAGEINPLQFASGSVHTWSLTYEPIGTEDGQITAVFDGHTALCSLSPGHRADGATFNHFGLLNVPKHPDDIGHLWIDDVVINGAAQDSNADPGWDAFQNHASYLSEDTRPRFAFGYSATQFAGGGIAGEIGGRFYRGDCRDPNKLAYYGAPIVDLSIESPLEASGKVCFKRGVSDSTTLFGFFHSEGSIEVNPAQNQGLPKEFVGLAIEGPSAEGFYMYPCYRTTGDGSSGYPPNPPRIYPDSQTRDWTLTYDPEANGGNGEIHLTCGGASAVLPLRAGDKALGARFNRFGFITPWIDGNGQIVYFDDLRYTYDLPTTAAFSATPTVGSAPLEVTFTDQSTAKSPITDWTWDFGDGSPVSHEQNPVHTYADNGAYTVALTVSTATDSNTASRLWFINVGDALPLMSGAGLACCVAALAGYTAKRTRRR